MSHEDIPAAATPVEHEARDRALLPREHWHHAVVALGSNLGDREETLFQAVADLRATEGIRVLVESGLHETVALTASGYDDTAPGYVNQVVLIETAWQPEALLDILLGIEAQHGRTRDGTAYANRTLDLDLISYDDVQSHSSRLTLPHPRAHEREFVLRPWSEIDPEATLPGLGPVRQLLSHLGDQVVSQANPTGAQEQA
ncbi:2-amino-4-hydroxy-6-hydroxymethyldihydropteridine diphosphokinase [Pontimonas salivibrio]|uniref:2-amino-4-hydroxy-6-hydroxymethyldihydropteridine diphosphokinase n=1 Tax=Pontimonas salivibrio TaxID=1159327 RepID=A0A2L2BN48_9MICO|nr:2-amino-4-hydroxy-6-hydroxymethyldihydropteridine diphosphokinase [Pontimonas salivibrio]AVG23052.1 2-amino-4-hydroxy-6-hydroxymethyldihydropteridine diphosphokinase [Pontimonas salivibrio]